MHHQCKSSILFPVFTICRYNNFFDRCGSLLRFPQSVRGYPGFCRLLFFHPLMQTDAAQSLPHSHNPGVLSRCRLPAGYFPAHKAAGRNSQTCPCKPSALFNCAVQIICPRALRQIPEAAAILRKIGAVSRLSPSIYCISRVWQAGSSSNSNTIGRITGVPSSCASTAFAYKYGIRSHFSCTKISRHSQACSSNAHGTLASDPCRRL